MQLKIRIIINKCIYYIPVWPYTLNSAHYLIQKLKRPFCSSDFYFASCHRKSNKLSVGESTTNCGSVLLEVEEVESPHPPAPPPLRSAAVDRGTDSQRNFCRGQREGRSARPATLSVLMHTSGGKRPCHDAGRRLLSARKTHISAKNHLQTLNVLSFSFFIVLPKDHGMHIHFL